MPERKKEAAKTTLYCCVCFLSSVVDSVKIAGKNCAENNAIIEHWRWHLQTQGNYVHTNVFPFLKKEVLEQLFLKLLHIN